jgi:hypothetical protein
LRTARDGVRAKGAFLSSLEKLHLNLSDIFTLS